MHTGIELIGIVGQNAFHKGRAYAREGRATVLSHDTFEEAVSGTCRGSGMRTYQVAVHYQRTTNGIFRDLEGQCSCPVGFNCKHAVALMLTAHHQARGPAAGARHQDWRDILTEAFPPAERHATPLALTVEFDSTATTHAPRIFGRARPLGQGTVRVRPMRPGKRSTWIASGATWADIRNHQVAGAAAAQLTALTALYRLHEATDPFAYGATTWIDLAGLDNPALWPVLEQIVSAGVHLITNGDHRPVTLEAQPGSAMIAIREDGAGDLQISAESAHPRSPESDQGLILLGTPPHGLAWADETGVHLAPLERPATPAWVSLRGARGPVTVPAADRSGFEHAVLPQIVRQGWSSPDESYQPPEPPAPALHLQLHLSPATEDGPPRAELTWFFQYQDAAGHSYGPLDLHPHPGDPARDQTREQELTRAVAGALQALPDTLDDDVPHPRAQLAGLAVVTLVQEVIPALRELGVHLETSELPTFTDAGQPAVQVTVGEFDRDWFDLEVMMDVAGHQVPIGQVITALANEQEALFLPDGRYVHLTNPELERLRDLLAESRALTDQRRRALRVSRMQVSWWEELLALGVVQTAEHHWLDAVRQAAKSPPAAPPVPAGLQAQLRPYQREGFAWLATLRRWGLGGVLADDMGLGKTVQVLAMILDERTETAGPRTGNGPWLVVAPTSVVSTWATEAARFAPDLRIEVITATQARRRSTLADLASEADVLVTSYALLRLEVDQYADLDVAGLVLDEAQNAKNHTSQAFASAKKVGAPVTFAVTGTPLENNLLELWAMTALVAPGLLGSPSQFAQIYRRPIERREASAGELLARLRRRIKPFLLRRTKEQVATDLPPKQEQVLAVQLAPGHRRIYDQHLQRERQRVLHLVDDLDRNRVEVLSALTRLRQLAIDAALVEPEASVPSSKLETLLPLLREAAAEGHRVLVFSQFTRYLAMIADRLRAEGLGYAYLDGSTRRRDEVIRGFAEGDDPVFLISLKAGGVGLNLTMADYAVLADPWWNPAVEAQAVDRTHRIGQQRTVMVYRLVAIGTIEEKVLALQESKRELVAGILADEDTGNGIDARAEASAGADAGSVSGNGSGAGAGALTAEDLRELLA